MVGTPKDKTGVPREEFINVDVCSHAHTRGTSLSSHSPNVLPTHFIRLQDPREIMRTVHPHPLDTIHPSQMSTSPTTEVQTQHRSQQQLHDPSREPSPASNIAQLVVKAISGPQTASSSPQNASQASIAPHSPPGTPQPTTNASISPISSSQPPALPPVDPNVSFILTASKDGSSSNGQHAPWSVPPSMQPSQPLPSPPVPRPVSRSTRTGSRDFHLTTHVTNVLAGKWQAQA
jgi:hypothetical protein